MYHVFARKYRPKNFKEVIGQELFVQTLTNALTFSRVAHAYILTGVRGVGKTSSARIIARALNCIGSDGLNPQPTPNPCDVCVHCSMIEQSRHIDVYEMDAASHTGIANIQELLASVPYKPSTARFKIYIIDEIHMLSEKAFNALLKTLEEPPDHIKFIFATTEIRKVPLTIVSRCQQFVFRRVDVKTLAAYLHEICRRESLQAEPEAMTLIASAAEGSVRDGLSLLDQAAALSQGERLSAQLVSRMLSLTDRSQLFDLFEACLGGEPRKALDLAHRLYANAAYPERILQDLLGCIYTLAYYQTQPSSENAISDRERLQPLSDRLSIVDLTRAWQIVLKGLEEVQKAPDTEQAVDMILMRLAFASSLPTPQAIIHQWRTSLNPSSEPSSPSVPESATPQPSSPSAPESTPSHSDNPLVQEIFNVFPGSSFKE